MSETEIEKSVLPRGTREHLPYRRAGYTLKFRMGGTSFYLRTGEYKDGKLGEIFLDVAKSGSSLHALANAFCMAVSLGLQYGVPLEQYIETFKDFHFLPAGQVLCDDGRINQSCSCIDYIVRELGATYLGRTELLDVHIDECALEPNEIPTENTKEDDTKDDETKEDDTKESSNTKRIHIEIKEGPGW